MKGFKLRLDVEGFKLRLHVEGFKSSDTLRGLKVDSESEQLILTNVVLVDDVDKSP